MTNAQLEKERLKEIDRLIREQAKDMKSRHVSKDGREFSVDPNILNDMGLVYDRYHGACKDDV